MPFADLSVGKVASKNKVEPGDSLILFTDGIIESRDETGHEYGRNRLESLVVSLSDSPPPVIVDRLFDDLEAFGGAVGPDDDRTVVVIRRRTKIEE